MKIIIPLLFCALNLNWSIKPDIKNWETKTINGKIETVKIDDGNCLKLSTTSASKSFVAVSKIVNDIKIGDNIEVAAEVKANTSRAKLVVTSGFKWGEKSDNGLLAMKAYGANSVWTKLSVVLQVKKLPLYINLGIYKAKNKYLLVKNVSVKPFKGKISTNSEIKTEKVNYPTILPEGNWEKLITGDKGELTKINQTLRLVADSADAWVALRQKRNDFAIGEEIIFTAELKAPTENAQLIVTDGFTWGETVNGNTYHKIKHSGSGEWEKLQARLRVSKKFVCLGFGMSRGAPNQWMEVRNIKIIRERDAIPEKVKSALAQLQSCIDNKEYPDPVRDYCKKLAAKLENNYSKFQNSKDEDLIEDIKKIREILISADSPLYTLENKHVNPDSISLDSNENFKIKVYNISRPHSIFIKIYAPDAQIWEFDKNGTTKFSLLEGNLFQVTRNEPTVLEILPSESTTCKLLPLDHRNKNSYKEFKINKGEN